MKVALSLSHTIQSVKKRKKEVHLIYFFVTELNIYYVVAYFLSIFHRAVIR